MSKSKQLTAMLAIVGGLGVTAPAGAQVGCNAVLSAPRGGGSSNPIFEAREQSPQELAAIAARREEARQRREARRLAKQQAKAEAQQAALQKTDEKADAVLASSKAD